MLLKMRLGLQGRKDKMKKIGDGHEMRGFALSYAYTHARKENKTCDGVVLPPPIQAQITCML